MVNFLDHTGPPQSFKDAREKQFKNLTSCQKVSSRNFQCFWGGVWSHCGLIRAGSIVSSCHKQKWHLVTKIGPYNNESNQIKIEHDEIDVRNYVFKKRFSNINKVICRSAHWFSKSLHKSVSPVKVCIDLHHRLAFSNSVHYAVPLAQKCFQNSLLSAGGWKNSSPSRQGQ